MKTLLKTEPKSGAIVIISTTIMIVIVFIFIFTKLPWQLYTYPCGGD